MSQNKLHVEYCKMKRDFFLKVAKFKYIFKHFLAFVGGALLYPVLFCSGSTLKRPAPQHWF